MTVSLAAGRGNRVAATGPRARRGAARRELGGVADACRSDGLSRVGHPATARGGGHPLR